MLAWWWCLAALVAVAKGQEFEAEAMQWSSLNVVVEPKAEECFYEVLKKGQVFEMDFEVGRGGLLDIEVVVTAPTMEIVHRKLSFFNHEDPEVNEKEGFLSLEARVEGQYMICFNNKMSRWTPKVVSFSVRGEAKAHPSLKQAVTVEGLGPVVDSIVKISNSLVQIEKMQHYLRVREAAHRDTQESTNARVQWISVLETFALFTVSAMQIYFIQTWFNKDSIRRGRV